MYHPKSIYSKVALSTIIKSLKGDLEWIESILLPERDLSVKRGCFVSLHKKDRSLRGCIGTIEPQENSLGKEIERNAYSAAFRDSRFTPLTIEELDDLEVSVDVLTEPEQIDNLDDLDPQIYGIIVSDNSYRKAVLLPAIPEIDTLEKQIEIVKRKAGLSRTSNDRLSFYRFTSNRYH